MLDWLPENISTFGEGVDHLFAIIYYITVGIFVLVNAVYIVFIIRYRRRKKSDRAYHHHGNNMLEFAWTALPFALFLFLAFYSDIIWRDIRYASHTPNPDLVVEVMGQTFMWHFRYPGSDGIFGHREQQYISPTNPFGIDAADPNGRDDMVTINRLTIPVNKTVLVKLSSMDVIHSFFLPNMRVKQDAIPGQWVNVWFNGSKTGEYEIACAELCGSGHYLMRGVLELMPQSAYDAWIDGEYTRMAAANAPKPSVLDDETTSAPSSSR